jgi:hypothetical protein
VLLDSMGCCGWAAGGNHTNRCEDPGALRKAAPTGPNLQQSSRHMCATQVGTSGWSMCPCHHGGLLTSPSVCACRCQGNWVQHASPTHLVDVQTIEDVPATQTAGVLEVGVCKERTYRHNLHILGRCIFARWIRSLLHLPLTTAWPPSPCGCGLQSQCASSGDAAKHCQPMGCPTTIPWLSASMWTLGVLLDIMGCGRWAAGANHTNRCEDPGALRKAAPTGPSCLAPFGRRQASVEQGVQCGGMAVPVGLMRSG